MSIQASLIKKPGTPNNPKPASVPRRIFSREVMDKSLPKQERLRYAMIENGLLNLRPIAFNAGKTLLTPEETCSLLKTKGNLPDLTPEDVMRIPEYTEGLIFTKEQINQALLDKINDKVDAKIATALLDQLKSITETHPNIWSKKSATARSITVTFS